MTFRDKLRQVLSAHDSPKKIAASFAVGVFLGMSPLFGLHTILGLLFAWILRLNKFVTIIGVYVTNPWTIIPIYTFATWFGAKLLGIQKVIPDINWNKADIPYLMNEMSYLLAPFALGSTLLGLITAATGYLTIYQAALRYRARKD
ncbi:MAG: DUF2062 domain-containing protein [Nitrospirae bacterium]|nr:DUF2062 domain-containing protein [Nitrospirota bacterium]